MLIEILRIVCDPKPRRFCFDSQRVRQTKIAKLGENISVTRFVRFKVGDAAQADPQTEPAAEQTA